MLACAHALCFNYCMSALDSQRIYEAERAARYPDVCARCLIVHAHASAIENFDDDHEFSMYDLSNYADKRSDIRWDNVTTADNFEAVDDYLLGVAADYLRNGDVICECES